MRRELMECIVEETKNIKEVMRGIDRSGLGIAIVVDKEKKMVGLVTDGDIRRAIIKGVNLKTQIKQVMNTNPATVRESDRVSDTELIKIMGERKITQLPVLDERSRIKDLFFLSELKDKSQEIPAFFIKRKPEPSKIISRVLVIGGAGYIGSVLARKLLQRGYKVRVLDALIYGDMSLRGLENEPNFEFIKGDTRHIETVVEAMKGANAVVHLAELVGDPACSIDPEVTLATNYLATKVVATSCKYHQINRFVFTSSCSVYGAGAGDGMLDEHSPLNPVSLYAEMKIESEKEILGLIDENFSPCILRLATVYGLSPRPRFDLVVNTLTAKAVKDGKITIFGGEQWRPNVHVSDVADALIMCLEAPINKIKGEIFNVGSNEQNYKICRLGELIRKHVPGTKVEIDDRKVDTRNYNVCFDKIKKVLGYAARKTVKDGILEIKSALESGEIKDHTDKEYINYKSLTEYRL